jgi:hypothetical protein
MLESQINYFEFRVPELVLICIDAMFQRNSRLARLKQSISHMSLLHANFVLQLVFYCWNIEKLAEAIKPKG